MDYYINPLEEEFIVKHGKRITPTEVKEFDYKSDRIPVCLVDNGYFTAAWILYHSEDAQLFLHLNYFGPKSWFSVSRADLKPYLVDDD